MVQYITNDVVRHGNSLNDTEKKKISLLRRDYCYERRLQWECKRERPGSVAVSL